MNKKPDRLIYEIVAGSRMYGTDSLSSDWDYRGIYLPSMKDVIGLNRGYLNKTIEFSVPEEEEEYKYYSLHKFMRLMVKNNPNILSWLFAPEDSIIHITPEAEFILQNRDRLLSQEIYHRFRGYAKSEYHSITKKHGDKVGEKRRRRVEKHGYNTKSASNVIRLLHEGAELLESQHLTYPLPITPLIIAVKHGEVSLKRVNELYEEGKVKLDAAYENTSLPEQSQYDVADELTYKIMMGDI